jgi:hypothetical protein
MTTKKTPLPMAVVEVTMPMLFPQLGRTRWHYVAFVLPSGTIVFKGDVYSDPVSHDFRVSPTTGYSQRVTDPLTPDEFRAVPWGKVQYTQTRYDTLRFEFEGVQLRTGGPRVYDLRLTKNCSADVTGLQASLRRKIEERRRRQRVSVVTKGLYCWLGDVSFLVAKFACVPDVEIVREEDLFTVKVPWY